MGFAKGSTHRATQLSANRLSEQYSPNTKKEPEVIDRVNNILEYFELVF